MAIQTKKAFLLFQLRAYHGYSKEDLQNKTIKELYPLRRTHKETKYLGNICVVCKQQQLGIHYHSAIAQPNKTA